MKKTAILLLLFIARLGLAQVATTTPWQTYMAKGQYAQALQMLQGKEDTLSYNNLLLLAMCHHKLGHLPLAKQYFQQLLLQNTKAQDVLVSLANIADKEGNLTQAVKYYQQLTTLDSTNQFYWKEMARNAIRQRKYPQGILYLEKALQLDSLDIESMTELANLHLNNAKDVAAYTYIRRAMQLDSNAIRVRQLRARYAYRISDFEQVRKDLGFTLAQGDSTVLYQRLLATAYYYLDSLPQAIYLYKRLLNRGENDELIRAGLGYAQLATTNENTQYQGFTNLSKAIELGTSEKISDYRIAQAEAHIKWKEYNTAAKNLRYIYDTYQRPKALWKLAEVNEKYLNPTLGQLFYQEYARVCQLDKNQQNSDCSQLNIALQKLNQKPIDKIYAMDIKGVLKDSTHVAPSDSLLQDNN